MERYLISLDLDDTLLTSDKRITKESELYLKHLSSLGHIIVLNSGRDEASLIKYYNQLGLETPFIGCNGSHIKNPKNLSFPELKFTIKKAELESMIEAVGGIGAFKDMAIGKNGYINMIGESFHLFLGCEGNLRIYQGDLMRFIEEDLSYVLFYLKEGKSKAKLEESLKKTGHLSARYFAENDLRGEIFHDGINKASGIRYVQDYYDIPQENTIAFGDTYNDIEAIEYARHGFFMCNGHEKLLDRFDRKSTDDCNHDGVIKTLQNFFDNSR